MLIPPFNLPSNPAVEVRMREATVADCIALADVNPAREEAAATMFLDAVGGEGADSRKWTADDRRFALLWYFVHTETDHSYQVQYDCGHCGEAHSFTFDLKTLLDSYRPINGKPERALTVGGQDLVVVPLDGAAMEALELERIGVEAAEAEHGADSVEARKARLQMRMNELLCRVRFAGVEDPESYLVGMSVKRLEALVDAVRNQGPALAHGLETEYEDGRVYFISPLHRCPNGKGKEETRCRVRFRGGEFIPQL